MFNTELTLQIKNPSLFTSGTDFMWTHPHISKQLLEVHLNPDINLASRQPATIDKTVKWLESNIGNRRSSILDLGCGPGLYCEKLAGNGHSVIGVDISENSISYARESAQKESLNIKYKCANYLNLDFENEQFDLVMMIFTDFGVLKPDDQCLLLEKVFQWLKPGGKFIFDVMAESGFKKVSASKTWDVEESGFWRDEPCFVLSEIRPYNDVSVILSQYIILEDDKSPSVYRFWTQYFTNKKINSLFESKCYSKIKIVDSILPDSELYKGEDVNFIIAEKT